MYQTFVYTIYTIWLNFLLQCCGCVWLKYMYTGMWNCVFTVTGVLLDKFIFTEKTPSHKYYGLQLFIIKSMMEMESSQMLQIWVTPFKYFKIFLALILLSFTDTNCDSNLFFDYVNIIDLNSSTFVYWHSKLLTYKYLCSTTLNGVNFCPQKCIF